MFFSNLKIRGKLLLVLVTISLVTLVAVAVLEFQVTRTALERASFDKLTAVREMKAQQIEDYFDTINKQMLTFAENETVINALKSFTLAFKIIEGEAARRNADLGLHDAVSSESEELRAYYHDQFYARLSANLVDPEAINLDQFIPEGAATRYLQGLFISGNPNPTGEKEKLESAGDGSVYDNLHERYHPRFRSFLEKFGFYDIFLVEPSQGYIVYSVYKEVDFATSLLTGPHKNSGLGAVVKQALESDQPGSLFIADFDPYVPSYNSPAAFIASPVFAGDEIVGVAAFQMPIDRINDIMTSRNSWSSVGLGASGETYIVGADFLMRNQSRFLLEDREEYLQMIRSVGVPQETVSAIENFNSSIGLQEVRTKGTSAALAGFSNTEIFADYRGVNVLSSYRPLDLQGLYWVIMSEIDEAEAFDPIETLKKTTLLVGAGLLIVIIFTSLYIARALSNPIKGLTAKAEAIAAGDLEVKIEAAGSDEVSVLARSFDSMRQSLRDLIEGLEDKVAERTRDLQDSETRARAIVDNTADGLIVLDDDGIVETFSLAAEKIFGHSAETVLGKKVNMLMPEPMQSEHDAYMHRYYETGEKRVIGRVREVTGLRKNGQEFPMDLTVGEFTVGGKRYFVGIIRDITERKIVENELAEKRERLELALDEIESVSSVIIRWNPNGEIVDINKFGCSLFGYTKDELIGQHVIGSIVEKSVDNASLGKMIDDLLEFPERYEENQNRNIRKNGEKIWMLWSNKPIADASGNLKQILSIGLDITKQKDLERQLSIANKRMGDELNIGRQIQMSMIPLTFPRFPEHKDLDVWAFIRPAREVGGDFYDFFFIDERHFAFVVADVSGKGVPAALLMAVTKTLLKARSQDTQSTAKIIETTNNELSQNNADCMFITTFFGIIDTQTGVLTYTNAGHNPPFLIKPDGQHRLLDELHGPMVGVMEGMSYQETQIKLGIDEKLLVYTDGVTEAFDEHQKPFGDEGLTEFVDHSAELGTKYLVDALIEDIDAFVGEAEQADDITAFCLRYVAWDVRDDRARINLHLANQLSEIDRCLQALGEFCDRFHLSDEVKNGVSIVLDDLLNNVINYAFQDEEEHLIDVSLATDGQRFIVTVTDDGVEFDPFAQRIKPDTESGLDEREIGGLGIHLIRNLMDDVSYRRIDEKNVTILMKRHEE